MMATCGWNKPPGSSFVTKTLGMSSLEMVHFVLDNKWWPQHGSPVMPPFLIRRG